MKKPLTRREAIDKVISEMEGIMTRKELVEAVLKLFPSKAKDPASSIMNDLRFRPEVVQLGNGRYARADYVLEGGRFRVKPAPREINAGILNYSWFIPFDRIMPPNECVFASGDGKPIPLLTRLIDADSLSDEQIKSLIVDTAERFLGMSVDETFAAMGLFDEGEDEFEDDEEWEDYDEDAEFETEIDGIEEQVISETRELLKARGPEEMKLHDFTEFFQENNFQEGDALIITMKPKEKRYIFEYEPASQAQRLVIRHHDVEMNQLIHDAIKRNKRVHAHDVVFKAFGNFEWLKEYPSSHWIEIVERDDQLRLISMPGHHLEIASIEYQSVFDMFGTDRTTEQKRHKHAKGLEEEIDDFCDRFDEAYEKAVSRLMTAAESGGVANVIRPVPGLYVRDEFEDEYLCIDKGTDEAEEVDTASNGKRKSRYSALRVVESSEEPADEIEAEESDHEKIRDRNNELIARFFESCGGDAGPAAGKKAGDVDMVADFLSDYHGCSLEYADYDMLEEFLFMWYPRKALNSSPSNARHIASSLRDFYRFLVASEVIESASFAEALYEMRDLAGEKVRLYDRLPPGEGFEELFERLFGWGA